ncbi:MAG: family 43 glycosylhydrolase [Oscillospiraceae bacterium]|nr:family 43 glycosylhydrolase [Oscillospiraceae bacterium]
MKKTENGKHIGKFNNPLYQGQDPFITYKDGYYYLVASSNSRAGRYIYVAKSDSLIDQGEKVIVYRFDDSQHRIFAPEIFFINGKWYIYYCSDYTEENMNHYAGVLESVTDDPQGEYIHTGPLYTGTNGRNLQANDFTVFEYEGQLYGTWGTMPDSWGELPHESIPQPPAPAIVKMESPTEIKDDRIILSPGTNERIAAVLNGSEAGPITAEKRRGEEGPRVLRRNGKLFITTSQGPFADVTYRLGIYAFQGGSVLNPENWIFRDNVFNGTADVYSAGRASFVKSADGTEDWIIYHSKIFKQPGNGFRNVNIQKFGWDGEDNPVFGTPVSPFEFQYLPSGDPGIGLIYYAENASCKGGYKGSSQGHQGTEYIGLDMKKGAEISFVVETDRAGSYFVRSRYAYSPSEPEDIEDINKKETLRSRFYTDKISVYVNGEHIAKTEFTNTGTDLDRYMYQGQQLTLEKGANTITYKVDDSGTGSIRFDYIAIKSIRPPRKPLRDV